MGYITHPRNNTSVLINSTIGFKFTSNYGVTVYPINLGIGYLQNFLGGKTYTVDNNGNVSQPKLVSNVTAMLPYVSLIRLDMILEKN